jgi:hypothetical protein
VTTLSKRYSVPIAIVIALAITPALSGCFGNPIANIVNGATGGHVELPGKSVPADFPKEIPLISGDVIYGLGLKSSDGQGWNVSIKVTGTNAIDTIKSELEGAGFTTSDAIGGSTADAATAAFTSDKYNVVVVIGKDSDNGYLANYTVTTASK